VAQREPCSAQKKEMKVPLGRTRIRNLTSNFADNRSFTGKDSHTPRALQTITDRPNEAKLMNPPKKI
jgi:hypothetical protein